MFAQAREAQNEDGAASCPAPRPFRRSMRATPRTDPLRAYAVRSEPLRSISGYTSHRMMQALGERLESLTQVVNLGCALTDKTSPASAQ